MGRDKLHLEVGGEPLVHRVTQALSGRCDEVILAGPAAGLLRDVRRVPDDRPGEGPLAGMEAGLSAARFPLVFVAAGDMPFLGSDLVAYLLDALVQGELQAVVPLYKERSHPLCAAYAREILPRLRSDLDGGVRAVREFVGRLGRVAYVEGAELRRFGDPDLLLMNINSPEDLRRARELAGG